MRTRSNEFQLGFRNLGERMFGGRLLRGNPRVARPISTKHPIHLVMRSSMAVGKRSLLHPDRARKVESMVLRIGKEKGVKVLRFVNGGHHLHLLVLPRSRKAFNGFVRSISGVAARLSLSKERGPASTTSGSSYRSPGTFWDARPLTRILRVRSDVRQIIRMIQKPDQWLDDFWKKIARFSSA